MTPYPLTPAQLAGMAVTAEQGLSRFGKLDFMAACLREEARRVAEQGPRPSGFDEREVGR